MSTRIANRLTQFGDSGTAPLIEHYDCAGSQRA
jgi:hypothetical protein